MSQDSFEEKLRSRPLRPVPPEWRGQILQEARAVGKASLTREKGASHPWAELLAAFKSQLAALLWPAPKAWAALAVVWLAMFVINYGLSPHGTSRIAHTQSATSLAAWREQERLLTELLEPPAAPVAVQSRPAPARPHSEAWPRFLMT